MIVKILGQDDWLIFARRDDGVLVFTVIELDVHWLDAPHRGLCWNPATERNCDGEGSSVCRGDCAYMLKYVTEHAEDYDWQECGVDTDGRSLAWPESEDEAFIAQSRRTHLPH